MLKEEDGDGSWSQHGRLIYAARDVKEASDYSRGGTQVPAPNSTRLVQVNVMCQRGVPGAGDIEY